ncbi:MAG: hypothetical protein GX061_03440 [Eubacteriaceae bacterium]|nr:hypothetical protein [Eubacteriaceae bacterium]
MRKYGLTIILLALTLLLCGCEAYFVEKDELIFTDDEQEKNFFTIIPGDYTDEFSGILLYCDPFGRGGIYTERHSGERNVNNLYLYDENGVKLLFSGENYYTEAVMDSYDDSIYFKEYNTVSLTAVIYRASKDRLSKVKVAEAVNRTLPFYVNGGRVAYVNGENELIIEGEGESRAVYGFSKSASVRKIGYCRRENYAIALVTENQGAYVLYKIDLHNEENSTVKGSAAADSSSVAVSAVAVSAIDANVKDFYYSPESGLFYLKTAEGGEQLYEYDFDTYLRTYILTGPIERLTASPSGGYIAYVTRLTAEAPTQSLWITTPSPDSSAQLAVNTPIIGAIFFAGESKIMFTLSKGEAGYTVRGLSFVYQMSSF